MSCRSRAASARRSPTRRVSVLRYVEHERACKPVTLRDYRSSVEARLLPAFGKRPVDAITPADIERRRGKLTGSVRTRNKQLVVLHGIFRRAEKAFGLGRNPAAEVE